MRNLLTLILCGICGLAVAAEKRSNGWFVTGDFGGDTLFGGEQNNQVVDWIRFTSNGIPIYEVTASGGVVSSSLTLPVNAQTYSVYGNLNNYVEVNLQNTSSGTNASSDLVVTADDGTSNSFYGDFGINSSTYSGIVAPLGTNTVFLVAVGNSTNYANAADTVNLFIGAAQTNSAINFSAGNALTKTNAQLSANGFALATNAAVASPIVGMGEFVTSNYDLYWVTPTKTNLVVLGH